LREKPGRRFSSLFLLIFLNRLPIGRLFGGVVSLARVRAQAAPAFTAQTKSTEGHPEEE